MAFFILKVLFFLSIGLLVHSYLFYPFLLFILYKFSKKNNKIEQKDNHPNVSIIISVYNESSVIIEKLNSILHSNYPKDKIKVYIGSDASNDDSNTLIEKYCSQHPNYYFFPFHQRRGKTNVINDLMDCARAQDPIQSDHIYIFTDANVLLSKDAIIELTKKFSNPEIGLVDSRIIPVGLQEDGISKSENTYIGLESKLKYWEGQLWGMMMGVFGGCFAIRSNLVRKVPTNFITDDFFITMSVLDASKKCISNPSAICTESIPNKIHEEFRRKTRISSGNFQNLIKFKHFLYTKPLTRCFAFMSHKVIRWVGPMFMIFSLFSSFVLAFTSSFFYFSCLFLCLLLIGIPLLDILLEKINIHIKIVRNIRYFVSMNIALFIGFIKYYKGIKTSSWEPPSRNK
ncbi:MAG: glycosyltransferase [Saprospiraceae bacterium]